jgi:predicted restriction endonuclease
MIEIIHRPEMAESMVALGVLAMAFSKAVRTEVYRRQHGKCAICGEHLPRLETHHIQPHCMYGSDEIENAVGLCHEDHLFADRMALRHNIYFPDCTQYDRECAGIFEDD